MTTITSEPPEEAIQQICEITSLGRDEAIKRLRANKNNTEDAINEYFNDPDDNNQKYKWDDSLFGADREGSGKSNANPSFAIQGPDVWGSNSYHGSAAPTRPPSRAGNNRSPLGRLIDLTAYQAAGAPTNPAQADADLARALAESAAYAGVPAQETGIVSNDTNLPSFGPATRTDYEKDQWAMVPTKIQVEASNRELAPSDRRREHEAPAFLRTTKDHRLGAIISIFHKIPLARNVLLSAGQPAATYGMNSEWWNGKPILRSDQLAAMKDNEDVVWGEEPQPSFSDELHRLVAFLDGTDRSYGSVDTLAHAKAIADVTTHWNFDLEDRFFEVLKMEIENNPVPCENLKRLLTVGSVVPNNEQYGVDGSEPWEVSEVDDFALLDIPLDEQQYSSIYSLYDATDLVFWKDTLSAGQSIEEARTAIITKPGEVLTIRLSSPQGLASKGFLRQCEIPAVFYADRYLEAQKDQAIEIQKKILMIKDALQRLEKWEEGHCKCEGEEGCFEWLENPHDKRECCNKIIDTSSYLLENIRKRAQWRYFEEKVDEPYSMDDLRLLHTWAGPYELTKEEKEKQATLEHIIAISKEKLAKSEEQMTEAKARRKQCHEALRVISRRGTSQEDGADTEYFLRGVAITPAITYICTRHKVDTDLIELEESQSGPRDQWWKVGYVADDEKPVKVEKTELGTVLAAAGAENCKPILVYASETAMDVTPIRLTDALRKFVKVDNKNFGAELNNQSVQEQAQKRQQQDEQTGSQGGMQNSRAVPLTAEAIQSVPMDGPAASAKRKHSTGSSVATIGSSHSRELMDYDNTPTISHEEFASPAPINSSLGDIVQSLANCRTNNDADGSASRIPEMKERSSGQTPFLTRPPSKANESQGGLMDMDMDMEEHDQHMT